MPAIPQDWTRRADAVTDALAERHGTSQTWQLAERQSPQIADLLCLAPAAGEQKFSGATALGDELFLSATQPRDMYWSVVALSVSVAGRRVSRRHGQGEAQRAARPPVLGFGGFVDGIVLREILQWHHMISGAQSSETLAGLELNVVADCFFHVVTWLLVMAGSIMTLVSWRQGRLAPTWSFHFGLLVAGWGFFNVVEGLIDHQLLGVHHARDDLGAPLSWDIGFLVFGVILIGAGWVLYRRGSRKLTGSAR